VRRNACTNPGQCQPSADTKTGSARLGESATPRAPRRRAEGTGRAARAARCPRPPPPLGRTPAVAPGRPCRGSTTPVRLEQRDLPAAIKGGRGAAGAGARTLRCARCYSAHRWRNMHGLRREAGGREARTLGAAAPGWLCPRAAACTPCPDAPAPPALPSARLRAAASSRDKAARRRGRARPR